jgi:predicted ATPase/DNA-binding SARP family transcriptional activator
MNSKVTYRQQYTRCGKQRCRKCREGVGHGPYWYAYWSEKGRTISKYVGTNLPTGIQVGAQFIAPTGSLAPSSAPPSDPAPSGTPPSIGDPPSFANTAPNGNMASANHKNSRANGDTTPPGHTATVAHIISIDRLAPVDRIIPPAPSSLPSPLLRVYVLGQFRVERKNGDEWCAIDSRIWHRRRARALLGCLLSSSGRRSSREQVMELLWPDLDITIAANRLNGAVHELRQILEPEIARPASSRMLRLERDILEIADSTHIWVDAEAFERLLKDANNCSDPHEAERLLEEASSLYRGGYLLEELYSEWASARRDALQRAWIGLLLDLANLRAERGALANAIETLDRLRTAEPTNETALQRLMILLTQLDRRGEALQIYSRHISMLQRDYEGDPLPETQQLYEELRQGKLPSALSSKMGINTMRERVPHPPDTSQLPEISIPSAQEPSFSRPILHLGRHNQSPLIGRQRELETMRQVMLTIENSSLNTEHTPTRGQSITTMDRDTTSRMTQTSFVSSRSRRPHFLLLMGEPGIGKTRLAEELSLAAYTRDWAVAWSRSYEQEGTIPYRPWTEFLRTLLQGTSAHGLVNAIPTTMAKHGTTTHGLVNGTTTHGLVNGTTTHGLVNGAPTTLEHGTTTQTLPFRLERLSALLPEFAPHGRDQRAPTSNPLPHEQERLHLWEATLGLIDLLSTINPLLLVFDDLHWADESSIELLTYLVHHLKNQRVLLLATCRDAELPAQHKIRTLISDLQREQAIVALSVQPLSQSQIGALVSHLPEHVIQSIQTQAAGNPFFAEELARYVETISHEEESASVIHMDSADQGRNYDTYNSGNDNASIGAGAIYKSGASVGRSRAYDTHEPDNGNHLLPEAIAAVLERRLSRLSGDCQALLGKAAVLGGSFELGQLLPMANEFTEDVVLDLLDEALHAGLLTEEGMGTHITYHFWHPLIISHLYERLSAARRAHFHRKAAEAIKSTNGQALAGLTEKVVAAIVYHLSRGGGSQTDMAYYAELAGNQAYAIAAYSEAQRYYLQTINAIVGGQYHMSSEDNDIHSSLRRITPQIISQLPFATIQHVSRILERTAECNMVQGNFEDVRYLYECVLALHTSKNFQHAMNALDSDNTAQVQQEVQRQALLWREIGNTWTSTSEYARAYECYGRGKEIMRSAGMTTGVAWACLHSQYGGMLRLEGHYHEAKRYLQEALMMLERSIDPGIDYKQIDVLAQSIHEEQRQSQKDLHTRIERTLQGDPFEIGYAHEQLGVVLASSGPLSEGLKHMQIALTIYEQGEMLPEMARICSNLGATYISKGEHAPARDYLHRSLDLAERIGDLPSIATVTSNLGDVAQRSGNLLEAEEWFKRSLDISERINDRECVSWSNIELANVQRDLGKLEEAKGSLLQAIIIGRTIKSMRCIRYALVGLGELRIVEAMQACPYSAIDTQGHSTHEAPCKRLLLRAMSTLQRALSLDELEIEAFTNGKHLQAMAAYLLDDVKHARQMALQTLKAAQENETGRVIGRANRLLGQISMSQGQHEQADLYFEQAISLFREGGLRLDYARTLYTYGAILLEHGKDGETTTMYANSLEREAILRRGIDYLQEARRIFTDCHAPVDRTLIDHIFEQLHEKNTQI